MSPTTLYTIGHSDRSLEDLLDLLRGVGIETLVDVRAEPRSRRHPQFSADALRAGLAGAGITYHWAGPQLGGRRTPRPDSPHVALTQDGMRGYADHMDSDAFQVAAAQLISLAVRTPLAILCAERLPEHCHRGLIADYLTLQGVQVMHIIGPGEVREHHLSPSARRESAQLIYDRNTSGSLELD